MQTRSLETLLKLRLHDGCVGVILDQGLDRHSMERLTDEAWSRQRFARFLAGPEQHYCSSDRLERVARALGLEVEAEIRIRPAGPRQLPSRHAVPLAA